jgi:CheY-like chemotaxis protein
MPAPFRVCLLGFSAFEFGGLASSLRLAGKRKPAYVSTDTVDGCDFIVANADHAESLAAVVRAGMIERTLYIATSAPPGADGWLSRPIDPTQLMRELDHLVSLRAAGRPLDGDNEPDPDRDRDREIVAHSGPGDLDSLPPARAAASNGRAGRAAVAGRSQAAPPVPARHARALLVDDSEIALRFLETRLNRRGVDTERATNSGKAISLLSQQDYDMVFVDVELGTASDLDGLSLCQHIKRHHQGRESAEPPVVVMVSAHHTEIDRARGNMAGADGYLGKPLDEDVLVHLLRKHGAVPQVPKRAPR